MRELYWVSLLLTIIGGINWGLVGVFNFDLIAALFGEMTFLSRSCYGLIGVASIVLIILAVPRESTSGHLPSGAR